MATAFGTNSQRFPGGVSGGGGASGSGRSVKSVTLRGSSTKSTSSMSAAASASRRHGRGGSNNSSRPSVAAASSARDVTGAAVVGGTASFGDGEVEAEYIKNLQQQVYYLELEVNFLRGEVKKAASSSSREQEKAFAKAQRAKEQEWEAEATELESRLRQAEFDLETSRSEALAAGERYRTARDAHAQDKRDLVGQLAACKKQLEEATARCAQTEQHSLRMRGEVGQRAKSFARLEQELITAREQLQEQAISMRRQSEDLSERNADISSLQARITGLEEQLREEAVAGATQEARAWKEELYELRLKTKQAEVSADQERTLRSKVSDDCAALVQENAHLSSQLAEAEHSLARERSVSEDKQARLTTGIEDLAAMQDEARKHVSEIERLQEAINTAEKQGERLTSEVAEKTRQLQEARQDAFELRERIGAMARAHSEDREMNTLLRRDKTLLSEQVADVEGEQMRALHDKERLTRENHRLHKKLQEASRQIAFMRKAQNIPWANLSDLAGQVQQFTTDMEAGE